MALGRINISDIRKADKMVRAFVRKWMALPNDISIGYFYAPVSEGGLGIPLPTIASPASPQVRPSRASTRP